MSGVKPARPVLKQFKVQGGADSLRAREDYPFTSNVCNHGFKSTCTCTLYREKMHVHKIIKVGTKLSFEKRVQKREDF